MDVQPDSPKHVKKSTSQKLEDQKKVKCCSLLLPQAEAADGFVSSFIFLYPVIVSLFFSVAFMIKLQDCNMRARHGWSVGGAPVWSVGGAPVLSVGGAPGWDFTIDLVIFLKRCGLKQGAR